jgi:electron transfer flavoprotein beta subunit
MTSWIKRATETIRNSYSFGVDHGIHVLTNREVDRDLQPLAVAHILRQLVEQKKFDLVLLGKQSVDDDFNQTGQLLSRLLGWPQVTFISKMEYLAEEKAFLFDREIDGGIQKLKGPVNCVVTCDLRLNKPRQPKVAAIMKGRSKPIESLKLEDFQIPKLDELKVLSFVEPRKRTGGVMVKDVDELLAKLRTEARVI